MVCLSEHVRLYCNHNQVQNSLGEKNGPHVSKVIDPAVLHGKPRDTLAMEGMHLRHDQNHAQNAHALLGEARVHRDSKKKAEKTKEQNQHKEVIH